MDSVTNIAADIWNELVVASSVEPPLNIQPFFDEIFMLEGPRNGKVMVDFKRPTEMSPEEYKSLPIKNNWQSNIKYRLLSIDRTGMRIDQLTFAS
jgi:hypothetical protein